MAPAPMGVQQVFFNSLPMSQMANQVYQPVEAEIPQGQAVRQRSRTPPAEGGKDVGSLDPVVR